MELRAIATPLPVFAQVLILKELKVFCFQPLLQVLILKGLSSLWVRANFLGLLRTSQGYPEVVRVESSSRVPLVSAS